MPESSDDHARTRRALLDVAGEVFAEAGFREATVREICRRAGANIAAVNYHFGNKQRLYSAVLQESHRMMLQKYPPNLGLKPDATPEDRLHAFVRSFLLRIFSEGPHAQHSKLMTREMIDPTPALDDLARDVIQPMAQQLMQLIRLFLGPKAPDEKVRRHAMSVVSQVLFYHHCRPMVSRLFPELKFGPDEIESLAAHITQFSLAALRSSPVKTTVARKRPCITSR